MTTKYVEYGLALLLAQADISYFKDKTRVDHIPIFVAGNDATRGQDKYKGVGDFKPSVSTSLSLGDGGYAIVGFTYGTKQDERVVCFENTKGIDFYIHEGITSNIAGERIAVYVTPDKDPHTKNWFKVGEGETDQKNNGHIPFDFEHTGLKFAYWIKIEDLNSKRSSHFPSLSGFDLSTVSLEKICDPQIAMR